MSKCVHPFPTTAKFSRLVLAKGSEAVDKKVKTWTLHNQSDEKVTTERLTVQEIGSHECFQRVFWLDLEMWNLSDRVEIAGLRKKEKKKGSQT